MLGLRYFACGGCSTVYADVDTPPRCHRCESERFEEVKQGTHAAEYFVGRSSP